MTRQRTILLAKMAVVLAAIPGAILANRTGADPGLTGAPGDANCTACHAGTQLNSGNGKVEVTYSGGTTYTPGTKGQFTVTITDTGAPERRAFGFEATPRQAGDPSQPAGRLEAPNGTVWVECADGSDRAGNPDGKCRAGGPEFVTHTSPARSGSFTFDWTPPDSGDVIVYVAANAANGDVSTFGDRIYTASIQLTSDGASANPNKPVISEHGVTDAFNGRSGVASNALVAIAGEKLAAETRSLLDAPGLPMGITLPLSLAGVSVTINGRSAPVYSVSPTLVKVLAPVDEALGEVAVVVTTAEGASDPATVTKSATLPALWAPFSKDGRLYVSAVDNASGEIVGGLGVEARASRSPRAGDVVQFYATGLGDAMPALSDNVRRPQGPQDVANKPSMKIGDQDVEVSTAALTDWGVYQITARIPAGLSPGDYPISISSAGQTSPENVLITISE